MKKSKIKVVISLMVLLVIMIAMNKSYAGMADLTDEMSDTLANEQLTKKVKMLINQVITIFHHWK